jgi:hypothetical protein
MLHLLVVFLAMNHQHMVMNRLKLLLHLTNPIQLQIVTFVMLCEQN